MADCEICGKSSIVLNEIIIDSAHFSVCSACRNLGPVVQKAAIASRPKIAPSTPYIISPEPEFDITIEYPNLIRNSRVKHNMSQKDLAKMLAEKESVIHRLETGKLNPSLSLARKMERFLGIKLVEKEE